MRQTLATIILASLLTIQGCAPFKTLPSNVAKITEINGTYYNDCDTNNIKIKYQPKYKLWNLINKKYENLQDSLLVKIEIKPNNKLMGYLFRQDTLIAKKLIKGKLIDNNCFYKKNVFYIIPFIPFIWGYENDKKRFYYLNNHLVIDWTFNKGGAFLIMAGGDKENYQFYFNKLDK